MTMKNHDRHALCAYGVTPDLSERLMQQYKDEDEVPLCELDSTNKEIDD